MDKTSSPTYYSPIMASDRIQRRINQLLDEADEAVTTLDWDVVRARAEAVLAFDPENTEANSYLVAAARALGRSVPETDQSTPSQEPATTPHQPASFASDRYHVKQPLGEGGKKKVYLAHDTLLDREVAFALIKIEGLDEAGRSRISREAQAMGRLGSHPNIVTVFDLGQEADQPYMVVELMGGGDVEGLIEKATDHRLPLEKAIGIARETCHGLEFAHSRGIIHRDLKPGNIWLTQDGIAKIGDLGLAVALDRSRLTSEGMMVGTVSYMPPEQAMGGDVTPQPDLYSLGAMLYEMVTGRPPFLGDDSVAIIGQHINTPPVSPIWHNSDCPRSLDALILRLLAKDPSERPGSANDVLSALDAIDLVTSVELPAATADEAHALDSLAGGVFVGRQREMGELKACLEDALSGKGRLVTLVGEPGIGKTRTAQELVTYAGLRGAQVLWGRCYEEQGVPPYWPWVQAIRSYVRERDPEQLRSEMGAGAADIAEVVSDVRERLPDLQPAPQLEPEQARFRLFDSITALLKTASQRQPLILVLDDLHWADQPSLLLLQFVARELSGARLLLIGTYRDMELSRQHPLAEALGELTRERLFQRVLLRGLSREDVGRFIEVTSGATAPNSLVQAVYTQTEGNPLFVTEVVRLLVQEGEVWAGHGEPLRHSDTWTVRIPEGVREVIGRRLNRLSRRCNDTLVIASVIGREFTLGQLTPLAENMTEDRLLEVLEEALAARMIEELPRTVGRYQFTHALTQETLTAELSTTRRVRHHARIAPALEELYGDQSEAHAAELAHHFAEAQTVLGIEKLVYYSLLAGGKALGAYAYEEALAHFQRALDAKEGQPPDVETAAIFYGLGRAQAATRGRYEYQEPLHNLRLAFDYYVETGDVETAVAVAQHPISVQRGVVTGRTELISKAMALAPPDSLQAGLLLAEYGFSLYEETADYDGALDAFGRALVIAEKEQDQVLEMRTQANGSVVDFRQLRWLEAVGRGQQAIELARRLDYPRVEVAASYQTARALAGLGRHDEAQGLAQAMLVPAEKVRDVDSLGEALWMNGTLSRSQGDWHNARAFLEGSLEVEDRLVARSSSDLAVLAYQVGDLVQGEARVDLLLELMSNRAVPPGGMH